MNLRGELTVNPFNNSYFIGYINHVNPQYSKVHFPSSTLLNKYMLGGEEFNGGLIGSYVTIEGENLGFIGKISELNLPEKERLSLNERAFQSSDFHPTAKIEILLSFDYYNSIRAKRTLNAFPNIGSKVYVCTSEFIQRYIMQFGIKSKMEKMLLTIGHLTSNQQTRVELSQQALFGRHCAVVGTTGGGKSWTVSKLLEGMINNGTKSILIDPTGEYESLSKEEQGISVVFGKNAYYSYKDLTIEDLFFLVKPAERIQVPKLIEAIRSLKCVQLGIGNDPDFEDFKHLISESGVLKKTGLNKKVYERFCYKNVDVIEDGYLSFNIENLERQINEECVYDSEQNNHEIYGRRSENDLSNCISLITRISGIRRTGVFNSLFGFNTDNCETENLKEIIDNFLAPTQNEKILLRIGFEQVGFESQAREITANAIGKYLLTKARSGFFKDYPVVLFVDEAHQFLNKSAVDQYFTANSLSSFDQIAKECRKYGLFLCIATQMPKDIPLGTLSQMGTFIVHRLINTNDKDAIRQACSSASSDALAFLPVLGAGEALLTGVDFPMPLTIKVDKPIIPPNSATPLFRDIKT